MKRLLTMTAVLMVAAPAQAIEWLPYQSRVGQSYLRRIGNATPRIVVIQTTHNPALEPFAHPETVSCQLRMMGGIDEFGDAWRFFDITPKGYSFTNTHPGVPQRTLYATYPHAWNLLNLVCNRWGGGVG
jgi:hypothetical protein